MVESKQTDKDIDEEFERIPELDETHIKGLPWSEIKLKLKDPDFDTVDFRVRTNSRSNFIVCRIP